MKNKKCFFLIIAVLVLGLSLTGGTYAFLTWGTTVSDNKYIGNTTCFLVDYDYTNDDGTTDISGTLRHASVPKQGLVGKITMSLNPDCDVKAVGDIYLKVNSGTSSKLYSTVPAHCENFATKETVLLTQDDCSASEYGNITGNKWITNGSALKYALYSDLSKPPVRAGYINSTNDITINSYFLLDASPRTFYLYIWLDGELTDSTYSSSLSFNGYVHLGASQIEKYYGDVDFDGMVTTDDTLAILWHVLHPDDYPLPDEALEYADVDLDGDIDVDDVLAVNWLVSGITDRLPVSS